MISVVIVTYDSAACVGRCLASVLNAFPNDELVVVDNCSRDETVPMVRAAAPQARIIESSENVGFGRACNAGVEAANGSHVLLLNPDVVVTGVDGTRLQELLAASPFGLVAPALEGEGDRRLAERSWPGEYLAHTLETLRPREWRRRTHPRRASRLAWVSAAMLLISRDEFLELGGFDPRFFLYYEDRDLSRRYRLANLPVRTTELIHGRHTAGTSSASDGLRAGPMAWSLLGWLQYMWIYDSERMAWRAAWATLTTLRVLRLGMRALGAFHWERAQRKEQQLDELLRLLSEHASGEEARFCPDAVRLVRGLA